MPEMCPLILGAVLCRSWSWTLKIPVGLFLLRIICDYVSICNLTLEEGQPAIQHENIT